MQACLYVYMYILLCHVIGIAETLWCNPPPACTAMGLPPDEDSAMVKIHLFFLLSVVARHSEEGYKATISALDNYKVHVLTLNYT